MTSAELWHYATQAVFGKLQLDASGTVSVTELVRALLRGRALWRMHGCISSSVHKLLALELRARCGGAEQEMSPARRVGDSAVTSMLLVPATKIRIATHT